MNKSLYGLKQASRTFYKRLVSDLKRIGFEQSLSDPWVLRFMMGDEVMGMVAIHVDDILYAGTKSLAKVVVKRYVTLFLRRIWVRSSSWLRIYSRPRGWHD